MFEVQNEIQLRVFLDQKSKDVNLRSVEFIQTCVKDAVGIGKLYQYHFFAPLNEQSTATINDEINYQVWKTMPSELSLLK
jgi:hypothetical protein